MSSVVLDIRYDKQNMYRFIDMHMSYTSHKIANELPIALLFLLANK